ncbi:20S proteasome subunit beta 3 [Nematocida homosporus]|uniref:20S proteasome subunit beta 3 n=1 Tax=Nematocida homosporus TaxID=1912981 RepID=UPI00221E46F6|nr:20S proteasome subunit beta 3 [Nematocida homosporus]KAI5184959.1 20S proteasome subunit beta 3 [Nematocida homosporus]
MSSIDTHYGGSILVMRGKDAIVITADRRFGNGPATQHCGFSRLYTLTPNVVIGLACFVPDCQIIFKELRKHANMFRLSQSREIEPQEVASLLSYILYSKRFSPYYIDPIVTGFDRSGKSHIYTMDCIGCISTPPWFATAGTAAKNLTGISETLYEEGMETEDLFTTSVQAFLNAVDRDALSGWGAESMILTPQQHIHREIVGRMD